MFHPKGDRLVTSVVPNIPTWAIFYDFLEDRLQADPVMFFNVWESRSDGKPCEEIHSVVFFTNGLEEATDSDNFLGLSLVEEPDPEGWKETIEAYKQKVTVRRALRQENRISRRR